MLIMHKYTANVDYDSYDFFSSLKYEGKNEFYNNVYK